MGFLKPTVLSPIVTSQVRRSFLPRSGNFSIVSEASISEIETHAKKNFRVLTSSVYRLRHKVGKPLYYTICAGVLGCGLLVGGKVGGVFGGKKEEVYYRSYWERDRR